MVRDVTETFLKRFWNN